MYLPLRLEGGRFELSFCVISWFVKLSKVVYLRLKELIKILNCFKTSSSQELTFEPVRYWSSLDDEMFYSLWYTHRLCNGLLSDKAG